MAKEKNRGESVMLESFPEYRDPWKLIEHGVAAMVRVSRSNDMRMALKAAEWLVEYAESLLNGKRQANEAEASGASPQLRVC